MGLPHWQLKFTDMGLTSIGEVYYVLVDYYRLFITNIGTFDLDSERIDECFDITMMTCVYNIYIPTNWDYPVFAWAIFQLSIDILYLYLLAGIPSC